MRRLYSKASYELTLAQDQIVVLGPRLETVSRIISRLARQKLIAIVPDGVRLLDVALLEELSAR